jgi:hypothetical protein
MSLLAILKIFWMLFYFYRSLDYTVLLLWNDSNESLFVRSEPEQDNR